MKKRKTQINKIRTTFEVAFWRNGFEGRDNSKRTALELLCGDGTVLHPDGGGYLNLFFGSNCIELHAHTYMHMHIHICTHAHAHTRM